MGLVQEFYFPIKQELKEIRDIAERKKETLKSIISSDTVPMVQRAMRLEMIMNLTNYSATGSKHRHKTIAEAFWMMEQLLDFQYNKSGSFTPQGARERLEEDVTFKTGKYKLSVELKGRLKEMEEGDVNWKNLRKFFYNVKTKNKISLMFPNYVQGFYQRLTQLFNYNKDPTMPRGRPYISMAVEDTTEYMNEAIKDSIERAFGTHGEWRQR